MPIFVSHLMRAGACFAGLEGAGGQIAASVDGVDAGDRYISAGQQLPSLLARRRDFSAAASTLSTQSLAITLRDYQNNFADEMMRRHRLGQDRGLLVLPTGAGKTISVAETLRQLVVEWNVAQNFSRDLAPNGSSSENWTPANWRRIGDFHRHLQRPSGILFVAHRDFLLRQAQEVLGEIFGADSIGIVQGNTLELDKPIVVASAQTLIGILDQIPRNRFGLVVLDEAHHYVPENRWSDVLKHLGFLSEEGAIQGNWPRMLIGMTATPDRLTGSPLLHVYGPEGLVTALDAADLWDRPDRVILKPEVIDVSLNISVNDISGENLGKLLAEIFYVKLHRGDQFNHTLVYVNSTSQVPEVVEALNELGIAAEGLIGETPKEEREAILDRFAAGMTRVLVNVGVVGEGFDVPSVETVVLAFESESRTRVVQAIGRAMRLDAASPNKQALVVDLGGNTQRHRLSIQIREAYEAEGIQLKGTQNGNGNGGLKQRPQAEAVIGDIAELIFRGEKPTTKFFEIAFAVLQLSAGEMQEAAYHLGIPSDILFAYANGLRVPRSLTEVINIAREMGDEEGLLRDAWAKEKTEQMEQTHPLPEGMGKKTREWVKYLRYCLWHRYEGITHRVPGIGTELIQTLIQDGHVDCGGMLWERNVKRIFLGLKITGRKLEFLNKLNGYLEEMEYPPFEEWMVHSSIEAILIFRLKKLAEKLGRTPIMADLDNELGLPSRGPFEAYFERWTGALKAADLEWRVKGREALIADLQALAVRLDRTPRRRDLKGKPEMASSQTYAAHFGSYNLALKAAGLLRKTLSGFGSRAECAEALSNLRKTLDRDPTPDDIKKEWDQSILREILKRFVTFEAALIAAREYEQFLSDDHATVKTNAGTNTREDRILRLQNVIAKLEENLGRQPTCYEVVAALGEKSVRVYARVFLTFSQALKEAGFIAGDIGQLIKVEH